MGRFATYIAGRASSADKLPGRLPNVSLLDALLPRVISGDSSPRRGQPLGEKDKEQDRGSIRGSVTHTDVTKNKKGKLVMVQHRDKSVSSGSPGGGKATFEDVKKNGGNGDKADAKKDGAEDENEFNFTKEEDEKLIKLKEDNPTGPWAGVGEELGRPTAQVKQRFADLKKLTKGSPGDAKGGSKQNDTNQNNSKEQNSNSNNNKQNNNKNNKQNKSKKNAGVDAEAQQDWTAAEDAQIRQFLRDGVKVPEMAKQMDGREIKDIGPRIAIIKKEDESEDKNDGGGKGKKDRSTNGAGGQGQQNGGDHKSKKEKKAEKKLEKQNQQIEKKETEAKKEESKPKAPASKAGSSRSKAGSSRSEAKFTMREWMTLQEDDMFSFSELQLLSELISLDAEDSWNGVYSWLRVASLFADRTGRRVHPEDIREKFEAMARD